jgi:hypothetical protein
MVVVAVGMCVRVGFMVAEDLEAELFHDSMVGSRYSSLCGIRYLWVALLPTEIGRRRRRQREGEGGGGGGHHCSHTQPADTVLASLYM